jgi:hypothetical protein
MKITYAAIGIIFFYMSPCYVASVYTPAKKNSEQILIERGNDIIFELIKEYSIAKRQYECHPKLEELYKIIFQTHVKDFNAIASEIMYAQVKNAHVFDLEIRLNTIVQLLDKAKKKFLTKIAEAKNSLPKKQIIDWRTEIATLAQAMHARLGKNSLARFGLTSEILRNIAIKREELGKKWIKIIHYQKPHIFCRIIELSKGTLVWEGWLKGFCPLNNTFNPQFANVSGEWAVVVQVPRDAICIEFYNRVEDKNVLFLAYNLTAEQVELTDCIVSQMGNYNSSIDFYESDFKPFMVAKCFDRNS